MRRVPVPRQFGGGMEGVVDHAGQIVSGHFVIEPVALAVVAMDG